MLTIRWDKQNIRRGSELTKAALGKGVAAAAEYLAGQLRKKVGKPGFGGRKRSKPGEPPLRQTGTGQAAIFTRSNQRELTATIGVRVAGEHMLALEVGTDQVAPRPWLEPTIVEEKDRLERVVRETARDAMKDGGA